MHKMSLQAAAQRAGNLPPYSSFISIRGAVRRVLNLGGILVIIGIASSLALPAMTNTASAYEGDAGEGYKYFKSGQKYEAKEKYGRAVNAYYHAILMNPDYARAFRSIGRIYVKKGLYKDALDNSTPLL